MVDNSGLLDLDIIKKSDKARNSKNIKEFTQEDNEKSPNEELSKKNIRDKLYGRINVSVKTMDIVITVLMIALFVSVILGIRI